MHMTSLNQQVDIYKTCYKRFLLKDKNFSGLKGDMFFFFFLFFKIGLVILHPTLISFILTDESQAGRNVLDVSDGPQTFRGGTMLL